MGASGAASRGIEATAESRGHGLVLAIWHGYRLAMKVVNVAELKNGLSRYLQLVQKGETVLIRSRDRIVARLEGARDPNREEDDDERWIARLQTQGTVRRGKGKVTLALLGAPLRLKADLIESVRAEREEGR